MTDMSLLSALGSTEIVGLTLIGEARGEPIEGIIAVGNVIRNRLNIIGTSYQTYEQVCLADLQFSCWNQDDPNRPYLIDLAQKLIHNEVVNEPALVQCLFIASGIVNSKLLDNTKGARYYMVSTLLNSVKAPIWARNRQNESIYGHHTFFSVMR